MLPRTSRLTTSGDFRSTIRRGTRVGRPTLVLHAGIAPRHTGIRVGFVVSKAVGNAVTRNRVKRRLRHLVAQQLTDASATSPMPVAEQPGINIVVRALPAAAAAGVNLGTDLAGAWTKARGATEVKHVLILLLKVYRLVISPLYGNVCRYYPSCSAYALRAVEVHGAFRGSWLAARRLLRCHPWAPGGYDPVPGTPEYAEEVRDQGRRATTMDPAAAQVPPRHDTTHDQTHKVEDATMASRRGVN